MSIAEGRNNSSGAPLVRLRRVADGALPTSLEFFNPASLA